MYTSTASVNPAMFAIQKSDSQLRDTIVADSKPVTKYSSVTMLT